MSDYILINGELYHHGIKGMKWGKRRWQNDDGSLTPAGIKRYAKAGYSQDSYNRNKTVIGKVWDKTTNAHKYEGDMMYNLSSKKANKARAEKYLADKQAEKQRKSEINALAKDLNKNATIVERVTANDATRRLAAKYVVENNMTIKDAKKKANKVARRNTAAVLAAYGGIAVASLYMNK